MQEIEKFRSDFMFTRGSERGNRTRRRGGKQGEGRQQGQAAGKSGKE